MYSVIMMAAMATNGPDAVSFGHRRASYGCNGCVGCVGCDGGCGGCFGCGGGWGRSRWGGGWGCSGYGLHGCYGVVSYGQYGCHGIHHGSCFGNYGGTACYGGCYGSCLGCYAHQAGCYGGCYGQPIWYGPPASYNESGNPMVAPPATNPATPPVGKPADGKPAGGAAKLIIDIPATAKLFIDDMPMNGADTTRKFTTPALEPGQTYFYSVRVEGTRNGEPINETRKVLVRGGEIIRESFNDAKKADAVVKADR